LRIKNFKNLALSEERKILLTLLEEGLRMIATKKVLQEKLKLRKKELWVGDLKINLEKIKEIYLVAIGKVALEAAKTLKKILKPYSLKGIVLDVKKGKIANFKCFQGSHPLPSLKNQKATAQILNLLKKVQKEDLVIFVVSGGGTALLTQPQNINPQQEAEIFKLLFKKGASIQEMNILRKHLSLARGGNLAKAAYPATVISLIFSDVPDNDLQFIASGPTVKDKTDLREAKMIIEKFNLSADLNFELEKALIETPKEKKYFQKVKNILLVSNRLALETMAQKAKEFGLKAKIITTNLKGEAKKVAQRIIQQLSKEKPKTLLLYGGETTVKIKGKGKGGRNQELALAALNFIKPNQILIALASDGYDNTPQAGAIADKITLEHAFKMGLNLKEYLENNDSYNFFRITKDAIKTGPTFVNVADFVLALQS
jgi:glycerate 2-kinase